MVYTPKTLAKLIVSEFPHYTIEEARDFLKIFKYVIEKVLMDGDKFVYTGFLSFEMKQTKDRKYMTPTLGMVYRKSEMIPNVKYSPVFSNAVRDNFNKG